MVKSTATTQALSPLVLRLLIKRNKIPTFLPPGKSRVVTGPPFPRSPLRQARGETKDRTEPWSLSNSETCLLLLRDVWAKPPARPAQGMAVSLQDLDMGAARGRSARTDREGSNPETGRMGLRRGRLVPRTPGEAGLMHKGYLPAKCHKGLIPL